jgi:hypothetical protein
MPRGRQDREHWMRRARQRRRWERRCVASDTMNASKYLPTAREEQPFVNIAVVNPSMMPPRLAHLAISGALLVPLDSPSGWELLRFNRIPPHEVSFSLAGLRIDVQRSAGPVVYPLTPPETVSRVRAEGYVSARLALAPAARQGQRGSDDYAVRVGLVEAGSRRLSRLQRLGTAAWVERLFALAPPGAGIRQVRFLNVAEAADHIGASRQHPLSDLLYEQVVTSIDARGRFAIDHRLTEPAEILALWLSSDGDDTGSTFSVTFERLELD